jgi:hypothetical protein
VQAPVEIRYEGAVLAKGVAPAGSLEEGGTLFLALPDPMPVGTRLELRSDHETTLVRVVKVTESPDAATAGITVRHISIIEPVEVFEPDPPVAAPAPTPVAAASVAPAPVAPASAGAAAPIPTAPHRPAPAADANRDGANGDGRPVAVSGTIDNPAVGSGIVTESVEGGESVEVEDSASTSEYPALTNGAGIKRRKKSRKPR